MNVKLFSLAAVSAVFSLCGCSKESVTPPDAYLGNKIETGVSWLIPEWQGGEYTLDLKEDFVHWVGVKGWEYRVFLDGVETQTGVVAGRSLTVTIPENDQARWRKIVVEGLFAETPGGTPIWVMLVNSEQSHGMVDVDGVLWSPGNLVVKDGKFKVSAQSEELGLYFKHVGLYGVLPDGDMYSGKCYTPEEKAVALADIPEEDGDPCMAVSEGKLRMPSLYEMQKLFEAYDSEVVTVKGVKALSFADGKLLLPLAGGYDTETGVIGRKNTDAIYWFSGADYNGKGGALILSESGVTKPGYNSSVYSGSVRCVRNTQKPLYVSHRLTVSEEAKETTAEITTTPGDLDQYTVLLSDGYVETKGTATKSDPVAKIYLSPNTKIEDIVYKLFINGDPTGVEVVQPGLKNYAIYTSHTPMGLVASDAFTLSVTCVSDMDAFDVEVKTDDGTVALKETGSKSKLTVDLAVPANTSDADRILKIYVAGKFTEKSVTQKKAEGLFSVVWSPGYLTVENGEYVFAGEKDRGMYFRWNSRYGLTLDPTGTKYSGTAYGPAAETKALANVTYNDVDPCTLVTPAGTWRMPTQADWNDLLAFKYEWVATQYRAYSDASQKVYITPSGSITASGSVSQPTFVKVWSSTPYMTDPTLHYNLMGKLDTEKATFSTILSTSNNQGLMVRCVRNK